MTEFVKCKNIFAKLYHTEHLKVGPKLCSQNNFVCICTASISLIFLSLLLQRNPLDLLKTVVFLWFNFLMFWNSHTNNNLYHKSINVQLCCHSPEVNFSLVMSSAGGPGVTDG